jgi:hypothetical protein
MAPGDYKLPAAFAGVLQFDFGQGPEGTDVVVGQAIRGVRIPLFPASAISGRVIDERAQPVADGSVQLLQIE